MIRKVGTPYSQSVNRIRLRPITPNYSFNDVSVTKDDFRPDPSSGKYRSEPEVLDSALEQSIEATTFHQILDKLQTTDNELQHTIRGAVDGSAVGVPVIEHVVAPYGVAPLVLHGAGKGPPIPPPTALEHEFPVVL